MKKTEYLKFTIIYYLISFSIIIFGFNRISDHLVESFYDIRNVIFSVEQIFMLIIIYMLSFFITEKTSSIKISSIQNILIVLISSCYGIPFFLRLIPNSISYMNSNSISSGVFYYLENVTIFLEFFIIPLIAIIVSSFLLSKINKN